MLRQQGGLSLLSDTHALTPTRPLFRSHHPGRPAAGPQPNILPLLVPLVPLPLPLLLLPLPLQLSLSPPLQPAPPTLFILL